VAAAAAAAATTTTIITGHIPVVSVVHS